MHVPEAIDELEQLALDVKLEVDTREDIADQTEPQLDLRLGVDLEVGVNITFVLYKLQSSGLLSDDSRKLIVELFARQTQALRGNDAHAGQL